jgi:hypothetical protein
MQDYRAYVLGPDGHIIRRYDFFSLDDEAAKTHAKQYVDGYDVELWQLDRKVAFLSAIGSPPQLASCPAYIRIRPGVVIRSLPARSTM